MQSCKQQSLRRWQHPWYCPELSSRQHSHYLHCAENQNHTSFCKDCILPSPSDHPPSAGAIPAVQADLTKQLLVIPSMCLLELMSSANPRYPHNAPPPLLPSLLTHMRSSARVHSNTTGTKHPCFRLLESVHVWPHQATTQQALHCCIFPAQSLPQPLQPGVTSACASQPMLAP